MSSFTKRLARLTAICGLVATIAPAQAAYVVINADPAFGPAFPNLGWRAVGAIFVPDTCLANLPNNLNSVNFNPQQNGACGGIKMQDVKVGLYNLADPNDILEVLSIGTYVADITAPPDQANELSQVMRDITFDANKNVVGFSSTLSVPVNASLGIAGGGNNYFALEFSSATSRLVAFGSNYSSFANAIAVSQFTPTVTIGQYTTDDRYQAPNFAVAPVQTVPEPGNLALTGLALGIAALVARRQRR